MTNTSVPTLTEAIDTLMAEILLPFRESSLFEDYMESWKAEKIFEVYMAVLKKHGWNTLKEHRPADGEYCLLTVESLSGTYDSVPAKVFEWINGRFLPVNDFECEFPETDDLNRRVIAWMPLPQPFQGK